MTEDRDERAGRLLREGLDLAVRLRDREGPAEIRHALDALDYAELQDLAIVLAACVDVYRPISELVWWTEEPLTALPAKPTSGQPLKPCGTAGAYRRHLDRGEPVDVACESAYRRDEAKRKRQAGRETAADKRETSAAGMMHGDRGEVAA